MQIHQQPEKVVSQSDFMDLMSRETSAAEVRSYSATKAKSIVNTQRPTIPPLLNPFLPFTSHTQQSPSSSSHSSSSFSQTSPNGAQGNRGGRRLSVAFFPGPPCPRTDRNTVSGLSAAHTIYLAGGNVLLLDKNSGSLDTLCNSQHTNRSHRLLRRELYQSNLGHKRGLDKNASRREDPRQRQAVLR